MVWANDFGTIRESSFGELSLTLDAPNLHPHINPPNHRSRGYDEDDGGPHGW